MDNEGSNADVSQAEPGAAGDAVDVRNELVSRRAKKSISDANSGKSGNALTPRRNN